MCLCVRWWRTSNTSMFVAWKFWISIQTCTRRNCYRCCSCTVWLPFGTYPETYKHTRTHQATYLVHPTVANRWNHGKVSSSLLIMMEKNMIIIFIYVEIIRCDSIVKRKKERVHNVFRLERVNEIICTIIIIRSFHRKTQKYQFFDVWPNFFDASKNETALLRHRRCCDKCRITELGVKICLFAHIPVQRI